MRIEMIIFSGRCNPAWRLEPDDIEAFQAGLQKLTRVSGPLGIPEGLGYCGMIIMNEDQTQPWEEAIVYHEFVVIRYRNHTTNYLIDDNRLVENILLKTARNHVGEVVIESILKER